MYRRTEEQGAVAGLAALLARIGQCRAGYRLEQCGEKIVIRLADGTVARQEEMAASAVPSLHVAALNREAELSSSRLPRAPA